MTQPLFFDNKYLPKHIAIIMDGNGRWAEKRFMPRLFGHKVGVESVRTIVEECCKLKINYLTLYAFSTENWIRPDDEVVGLMHLLCLFLDTEINSMNKNGVKLVCIGDRSRLSDEVNNKLEYAIDQTKNGHCLLLNIALNYGGRDEIVRAVQKITRRCMLSELFFDDINEDLISNYLDTAGIPDPDLLIRTGGEVRLSNFLLWQTSYAELHFSPVFWPDFRVDEFYRALGEYQTRQRRYGKTGKQTSVDIIKEGCQEE